MLWRPAGRNKADFSLKANHMVTKHQASSSSFVHLGGSKPVSGIQPESMIHLPMAHHLPVAHLPLCLWHLTDVAEGSKIRESCSTNQDTNCQTKASRFICQNVTNTNPYSMSKYLLKIPAYPACIATSQRLSVNWTWNNEPFKKIVNCWWNRRTSISS